MKATTYLVEVINGNTGHIVDSLLVNLAENEAEAVGGGKKQIDPKFLGAGYHMKTFLHEPTSRIQVKKVLDRLVEFEGRIFDLFCNGGISSERFCNAQIGDTVEVVVTSVVDDRFFSKYPLFYIA